MSLFIHECSAYPLAYMIDDKPIIHALPLQSDDQDGAFKPQSSV